MTRRWLTIGLGMLVLATLAGCLGERVVEDLVLQEPDSVEIAVHASGWLVSTPDNSAQRVLSAVTIATTNGAVPIVWQNNDDRTHELMVGMGHEDARVFRLAPGESTTLHFDAGFEEPFHSHFAMELGELQLRIGASSADR